VRPVNGPAPAHRENKAADACVPSGTQNGGETSVASSALEVPPRRCCEEHQLPPC
jgi:hypothetical protein